MKGFLLPAPLNSQMQDMKIVSNCSDALKIAHF